MQTDNNENKVVSIFDRNKSEPVETKKSEGTDESFDFETIMKRNAENKGRQLRDRQKSNRGVIRSYRLKH